VQPDERWRRDDDAVTHDSDIAIDEHVLDVRREFVGGQ
jgi:hypothetical protein